jgi:23S rRNA (uracil1939-C5)-methyltransferase
MPGIEGVQAMVDRAAENSQLNNIENASFYQADLNTKKLMTSDWAKQSFNKILLDPSRGGALECMNFIINLKPARIVYVSCQHMIIII